MVTRSVLKYIRISPRKFRLIIPLVKGKNPEDAIAILYNVKKGASKYAIDILKSAIANARRMQGVDVSNLYISRMFADCGPSLKRFRAASMGRAGMIKKRTSHITVELDEKAKHLKVEPAADKAKAKKGVKHGAAIETAKEPVTHVKKAKPKITNKTKE